MPLGVWATVPALTLLTSHSHTGGNGVGKQGGSANLGFGFEAHLGVRPLIWAARVCELAVVPDGTSSLGTSYPARRRDSGMSKCTELQLGCCRT